MALNDAQGKFDYDFTPAHHLSLGVVEDSPT
jgi:hypothetical protein